MTLARRITGLARDTTPPFSPADISGLVGWWDASTISTLFTDAGSTQVTSDGDLVVQWNDRSGAGNHVSSPGGSQKPTYKTAILNGRSIVRFDSDDFMDRDTFTGGSVSLPYTMLAVGSTTITGAAFGMILSGQASYPYMGHNNDGTHWVMSNTVSTAGDDTSAHVFVGKEVASPGTSSFWVDGNAADTGTTGNTAMAGVTIGGYSGAASFAWTGDVAEALVYSGSLSLSDINTLGDYLATRWGLSWTTAT